MSPHDLDDISHKDAMNMWHLYQRGMAGPSVHYVTNYHTTGALHKLTELTMAINSKNKKPNKMEEFKTIYPDAYGIMSLEKPIKREGLALSAQAVLALMGPGTPKHIADSLQE